MTKKINWLNHIAEDWDKARIKDCIKKDIYNKNKKDEEDITFLPMTKVSSLGDFDSKNIKKAKDYLSGFTYFEKNDVLLAKITPCFENKKSAVLKNLETEKGYGSTEFHVFRTNHKLLNDYLYYIFNLDSFIDIGVANFKGSAGHKRVPYEIIESLEIPLPKKSEQEIIIKYLNNKTSKIDSAIAELEKQKSLLIELKKSTIHQAVTKGLDLTVPMKDSGVEWIGKIPKHWGMTTFKNKLIKNNGGCWGELSEENNPNAIIAVRSTEQTLDGKWNIKKPAYIIPEGDVSRFYLKPGDLLLTKSSGSLSHIGKTTLVENTTFSNNTVYSNFMQRLRFDTNINPKLMHYFINSNAFKEQVSFFGTTTTGLININASLINAFYMPFFSKEEQCEIVYYLDKKTGQIDQSIEVIDNQIAKMKEYKKTLINDVVTGKIKVI